MDKGFLSIGGEVGSSKAQVLGSVASTILATLGAALAGPASSPTASLFFCLSRIMSDKAPVTTLPTVSLASRRGLGYRIGVYLTESWGSVWEPVS